MCSVFEVDESDYESVTAHKMALLRKEQERSRWLNSPNAYQKIEILETGTSNPKRITKVSLCISIFGFEFVFFFFLFSGLLNKRIKLLEYFD